MPTRWLKFLFVGLQSFWMLVVLPGHVRGMIVTGPARCDPADGRPACCANDGPPEPGRSPSQDRKDRCAVCYQAHGYTLPPVFDFDVRPTGRSALCRPARPGTPRRPPCEATYFANGPPRRFARTDR